MAKDEPTFEIRTGPFTETVTAATLDAALNLFWEGKDRELAGDLMMIREVPWNTEYKWDVGPERRAINKRPGKWHYLEVPNGEG